MDPRRGSRRVGGAVLAAVLALAGSAAVAQDLSPAPRAPVLLFIAGNPGAQLPGPVGAVRAAATAGLQEALARAGFAVVAGDELLPHLMARRVRSAYGPSAAFLGDLAAGTGATHLLVAVLLVQPQRLQLLLRLTELQSACVVWAAIDDEPLAGSGRPRDGAGAAAWYAGLARLCRDVAPQARRTAPATARPLVLLPARAVACDQEVALAATHCLLVPVAADPRWRVVDPGVAAATLRDEGVPPDRLDASGRARLVSELGDILLVAPEIMLYGEPVRGGAAAEFVDPAAPAASAREYELALRFVDARTGAVDAAYVRHRDHGVAIGWFGLRNERSLLAGLAAAAHSLWQQVETDAEDR